VVAYDEAAAGQHIRHGHNGALAMPGDEEAFTDAARWLLEDSETLRRVRLNARQHASRQGWSAIIEQFERLLFNACQAGEVYTPISSTPAIRPGSSAPLE
jgi:glycosyltransferase involved in cell wall biosynthesis